MMGRIVALDVGDRRIGIAVSDEGRLIASPHSVYTRVGYTPDVKHIAGLYRDVCATLLVCGLPRNMDGSVGFQAEKVMAFADKLREAGLPVAFQDERLSTVAAHQALIEGGMRRDDRKGCVDKVAAAVILQQYLDAQRAAYPSAGAENDHQIWRKRNMADEINNIPQDEELPEGIIELTDEDGVTSQFEYLTTIEYENELYVVLMLLEDEETDDDEGEVLILKIEKDPETGEDIYVTVDDDEVSQAVFDEFVASMDQEEDE